MRQHREGQKFIDLCVGRIQATMVNLKIDPEKGQPLPVDHFLMFKRKTSKPVDSNGDIPKWQIEMQKFKEFTRGREISLRRQND